MTEDITVKDHGDFAERIFPCGYRLRIPIGYKLTKTFEDARKYLSQYTECETCKNL